VGQQPDRVRQQVERWARDLIDLTKRNRSLFYRPTKRSTLELVTPRPASVFESLLDGRVLDIYMPPTGHDGTWTVEDSVASARLNELVSNRTEAGDLLKTLQSLARQADQDLMDRGVQTLYACFGMLEWRESDDASSIVQTPLVYVPVSLVRESPRDPFRLQRAHDDILLNPSLAVKLEHDFGIALGTTAELAQETESLDEILVAVAEVVGGRDWDVRPMTLIKRSTFHKEAMYRDLLDNIDEVIAHDVVRSLAGEPIEGQRSDVTDLPAEEELDEVAPPEEAHLILDADASQRRAIVGALNGASFVMDGPPGTGKSQTIANMIAELLAAGRTILFVSEKAAALEVVANRLRDRGLDDYALELHSHKANRKEVVAQLARSLSHHPRARPRLSTSQVRRTRQRREELSAYVEAVNEIRQPLERSLSWVAGRLAQLSDTQVLTSPALQGELSDEVFLRLLDRFDQLAQVWAPVEDPGFVWHGFVGSGRGLTDRQNLHRSLSAIGAQLEEVRELADELAFELGLPEVETHEDVDRYVRLRQHLTEQPETNPLWWTIPSTESIWERTWELDDQLGQRAQAIEELDRVYADRAWQALADRLDLKTLARLLDDVSRVFAADAAELPLGVARIDQAIGYVRTIERQLHVVEEALPRILTSLGLSARERRLSELLELASAARAADAPVRPESTWVSAPVLARVREAIEILRPLQERFELQHRELAETFTDELYELDMPTVRARIVETKGLDKLRKPYREAKAQLRSVTRTGRVDRRVLDRVEMAAAAAATRQQLDERERSHGEVLGRFYRQRSTDADAVGRALELLETVLAKLGDDADLERVAAQFTGDQAEDPALARAGERLEGSIRILLLQQEMLGPLGPGEDPSIQQLRCFVAESPSLLHRLSNEIAAIEPLRVTAPSLRELAKDAGDHGRIRSIEADLSAGDDEYRQLLGPDYEGASTDVALLKGALKWVDHCRELLGGLATDRQVERCRRLPSILPDDSRLRSAMQLLEKARDGLLEHFDDTREPWLRERLSGGFNEGSDFVAELADRINEADVWADYTRLLEELGLAGLDATLTDAREAKLPSDRLAAALERATLTTWADDLIAADPRLERLRPHERHEVVEDFQRLDRELMDDAAERVIVACNNRRPRTTVGAVALIQREAQKKRRHMPVRTLLERSVEVATALKPCFMMSPLSVSQFLPSTYRFDVVIFDEASQIPPADAINCIYRGEQLIIAGDDRQLPPTSFFDASMDEDDVYEDEQFDDFESVLGLCKGTELLEDIPLKWHYRSRHEDLITFSNYRFYEGQLITYPGAETNRSDLGVELFVTDGTYRRGGRRDNPDEASAVVDRVLHHARVYPELSLGVVALSSAQAETIEDFVDRQRTLHPELDDYFSAGRLDGFFVKNLENVQGDERDIILLSIGYGPDESGKFTMNFGPLNREGGWRRLNVAITRARRRIEVLTSFGPEQMRIADSRARGTAELHRYLEYLQQGPAALAIELGDDLRDVESPFEEEVLRTLTSWGYQVVPQVGTAGYRVDLGIRHPEQPGRFLLGVECDGAAYHSSKIARDRDRLRQQVLEGLGWNLHRVWGPSWYRHREMAEEDLRRALEMAASGSHEQVSTPARREALLRNADAIELSDKPEWVTTYAVHQPFVRGLGRADSPRGLPKLREVILDVVRIEAPVHREVIGRRVAIAFDHSLTRRTQAAVDAALTGLEKQGELRLNGDFAWTANEVAVRVPADTADGTRRDAHHIPPEEVALAVHWLLAEVRTAEEAELLDAVKRLFGFARMGPRVQRSLDEALASLEERGLIDRSGAARLAVRVEPTGGAATVSLEPPKNLADGGVGSDGNAS
jgi:very-short-patch-repair endonuclease